MGIALLARFGQQGGSKDIEEAIKLHREALDLCPTPHPERCGSLNNLANAVHTRFEHRGDLKVLELHRKALALCAPPHPGRSNSINNLAAVLHTRFKQQGDSKDIEVASKLNREALSLLVPPHPDRGTSLQNLVDCFLTMFKHTDNTLVAYHIAIELLPQLDAFHLDLPSRREILSAKSGPTFASDAASCAIELEGARCQQLNQDWEEIIKYVRMLPGLKDFLQPKGINALKQAAVSGPIIILISTNSICSALIVTSTKEVQCLKLPELILPRVELLADLSHGLWSPVFDLDAFVARHGRDDPEDRSELQGRLHGGRERDYVVSSYNPTLTSLLDPLVQCTSTFQITVVIQPNTRGWDPLPGARQELKKLSSGYQNNGSLLWDLAEPLDSGLILNDSRLKVLEIMRQPEGVNVLNVQKYMSLPFLSACETAKEDKTVPDEAIHLAATLLFSGFG
ncbi:hypothetical protein B0H19DRAFT_1065813 [Mycena capillaripes]|nr:hypothetical protein B0H19DRAFT_1065813 [Mycena capillaripes]